MRGFRHGFFAAGLAVLLCVTVVVLGPAPAYAEEYGCRDIWVPVTPTGHRLSMHGVLCGARGESVHAVQVLVPGATYNQTYWNFPYQPDIYNFRLAMNRAGFATLSLDRLGTGSSSRPPSAALTASTQASAVHQVIQALRHGIDGEAFPSVIIGGHSEGSIIAALEAGVYHDVDGVLLTGISHHLNPVGVAHLFAFSLRPATLDSRFGGRGYDLGYLTTAPGTRAQEFYAPGTAEPGVADTDEATKDVVSTSEARGAVGAITLPASRSIDVPVLLANGARDPIVCNAGTNCANAERLKASEAAYFAPAAHLRTFSLRGFGHDINLAPNTAEYQHAVIDWAKPIAQKRPQ